MTRICYVPRDFTPASMTLIRAAIVIIAEYRQKGYQLTLRQLYYQFVARDLIPNTQRSYKNLGSVINDARLAGLIDWESIEDRVRSSHARSAWESPADMMDTAIHGYNIDMWENQPQRVEVWVEKDALVGVIQRPCHDLHVRYLACRGYVSQSEQWRAGIRLKGYLDAGIPVTVLHLGDHDPSGIDMTRDNRDRLSMFAEQGVTVKRIALNMDQIDEYGPPPNPAKLTDSRSRGEHGYINVYGDESWELDALDPSVIDDLIRTEIDLLRDEGLWDERLSVLETERGELKKAKAWMTGKRSKK
jgi:hypothetical protein